MFNVNFLINTDVIDYQSVIDMSISIIISLEQSNVYNRQPWRL